MGERLYPALESEVADKESLSSSLYLKIYRLAKAYTLTNRGVFDIDSYIGTVYSSFWIF
jgi:hypothetical protein